MPIQFCAGRIDATRWPYAEAQVNQHAIAPGVFLWGRMLGDFGERDTASTMPGYRTTSGGGLGGLSYADGDGLVFGIGGGYLRSNFPWQVDWRARRLRRHQLRPLADRRRGGRHLLVHRCQPAIVIRTGFLPGLSCSRTAYGKTEAPGVAARLNFGTNLWAYGFAVKPFVGLSYGWLNRLGSPDGDGRQV